MPLQNRMILSTSSRLSHWIRIISTWFRMDTDTTKISMRIDNDPNPPKIDVGLHVKYNDDE